MLGLGVCRHKNRKVGNMSSNRRIVWAADYYQGLPAMNDQVFQNLTSEWSHFEVNVPHIIPEHIVIHSIPL